MRAEKSPRARPAQFERARTQNNRLLSDPTEPELLSHRTQNSSRMPHHQPEKRVNLQVPETRVVRTPTQQIKTDQPAPSLPSRLGTPSLAQRKPPAKGESSQRKAKNIFKEPPERSRSADSMASPSRSESHGPNFGVLKKAKTTNM